MEIPGDGEQVRYYTYVADAAWALRRLMETPGAEGNIYNLGSYEETTMNELAQWIPEMTGSSSEIVHRSEGEGGSTRLKKRFPGQPDNSVLHRQPGYEPTYALQEILIEIITD
jgi:UDP-glucose 4-epimerase